MGLESQLVTALFNGLTWGMALALIALGLSLIFGLLQIVNLAHGSLYMLGAVAGWMILDATGSFLMALLAAPVVVGVLGVGMERTIVRPIKEDIPITMIATFGAMLVFQHAVLVVFGASARAVEAPIPGALTVGGVAFSWYRAAVAATAIVVMILLYLFLHRTRYGMWMRGVRQDPDMASALGIDTSRIYMLTFGLGAFFAALAGVLLAPIVSVYWLMGLDILAVAFIVVIVGGLGSLKGVLVISQVYALTENVSSVFVQPLEARILTLSLMILIVLIKPEGIKDVVE